MVEPSLSRVRTGARDVWVADWIAGRSAASNRPPQADVRTRPSQASQPPLQPPTPRPAVVQSQHWK